ncbi:MULTISPECIES: DeoR/GlpR family DNA-binding transcription regulator [Microbacterium]|uniref:DeoR/GlpR family DNA-binding transcription regulator n=1 Tax=Microbacterium resistens TaxID=156977 RepID=A0ABY3RNV1_9MICO|nr:DeoR/GlpR family DNA-binding transcription regulator [Microbacterium resistens]MBW1639868.1 DeoR/GlpR transcriptional regulator [Microbacterium resistens]MDA4890343.1 DeoR/GlpR family DNA-binding transcription regulator [Streptomyces sp. MS2A]UGS25562.1 DeoR/GlpR family DNA-binding transcription regulator [Microbacterium resistens]
MKRTARLTAILDLLAAQGEITVEELVDRFGASPATARRDLDSLAEQRLLTRTHGGAVAQSVAYELPIRYKSHLRADEKDRIGRAASALVAPGSVVGLSGGTTTTAIAAALAARDDLADQPLTIVTNAVNIAAQLATRPDIKVVVTGGVIHSRTYELVGPFVEQLLRGIRLDVAFIGVNGMDPVDGASTHDEREAAVNRIMAERARRPIVVADSGKIGASAFAAVGDASLFPTLLTDTGLSAAYRTAFQDAGYEVLLAD